jgi:cysteinyl-tRNA synthetase
MFRVQTDKYTEWDAAGLPTKNTDGTEVSKSMLKKLVKEQEKQVKLNEEFGIDSKLPK